MHLYRSTVYQDPKNRYYEQEIEIKSVADLQYATAFDYVCWKMYGSRCLENALQCDVIYHDYDNSHSDDPKDWLTIEKAKNELYAGIEAYFITSRNNNKIKDGKAARPRFHVFCPTKCITSIKKYDEYTEFFKKQFPLSDKQTQDAARFFYGFDSPEIEYSPGIDIIDWAAARWNLEHSADLKSESLGKVYIEPQGKVSKGDRNAELKKYAGHIKYDYLEKDKEDLFQALWEWNNRKLDPPLTEKELRNTALKSTWKEIIKSREKRKIEKEATGKSYHLNDIGDAQYLFDTLGAKYKWCEEKKSWLYFEKGVWLEDKILKISQAATDAILARKKEAKLIKNEEDKDIFLEHVGKLCNYNVRERILKDSRRLMAVPSDIFDRHDYLFNCLNGTLNLKTFDFYTHKQAEFHSKISGVNYEPQAKTPQIFLDFIDTTFEGDKQMISYLQKILGFALTGDVSRQEFYIFWGKGGNGKSQLIATLQQIMGSYAYGMPAKQIMSSKFNNNDTYLAQLKNVRALFCSESEERAKLDVSLVKQLTDENMPFNVAQKYEKAQQFYLKLHPFLIMNPEPNNIDEGADSTWRRIRLIPFTYKVPEKDRVLDYAKKMLNEGAAGIFNWYLEGLRKYYSEGMGELPDKVLATTAKYRDQSDTIQAFIKECCEVGEALSCSSNDLLDAYKKWSGNKYLTLKYFSPKIEDKGFTKRRIGTERVTSFAGLSLIESVKQPHPFDDK